MLRVFTAVVAVVVALVAYSAAGTERIVDHDYVGADRCRSCHAQEYAQWQTTPHARAYDALPAKDRTDPRCLSCHTVTADDASAGLLGVQCESCHGGGRHYAVDYVMKDSELRTALNLQKGDEKTCRRCHTDTSPSLEPFLYARMLERIRHWPARATTTAPATGATK